MSAVKRLYELYSEVGRREECFAELCAKKVTLGVAEAHRDMGPVVALFSECHELFCHYEWVSWQLIWRLRLLSVHVILAFTLLFYMEFIA